MPFRIPQHEQERQVLEKRLKLLTLFDNLIHAGISYEDVEELETEGRFEEFANVLNPCNVCDSIKSIYRPEQYAPPKPSQVWTSLRTSEGRWSPVCQWRRKSRRPANPVNEKCKCLIWQKLLGKSEANMLWH